MSNRTGRLLVVALLATVVAAIGVGPATAAGSGNPQQLLGEVQQFLRKAKTLHFVADLQVPGEAKAGTVEESAVFPDRGRSVITHGASSTEQVFRKDQVFFRATQGSPALSDLAYHQAYGVPTQYDAFVRPQDLRTLTGLLQDPRIVSTGPEGTVLRAFFKEPAQVLNLGSNPYTAAHVDVTVAPGGEPTALSLAATGPDGDVSMKTTELTWNGRVRIAAPSKAELLDKHAVTAFSDSPVYQPRALPRGWKLALAQVLEPTETTEGCREAETIYANPKTHQQDYLDLYMFPTSCEESLAGGQPFTIGPYRGSILEQPSGELFAQFDVNDTTVQVITTLRNDELASLMNRVDPLDFSKPPTPTLLVTGNAA
jgi:hypothetical protein